MKKVSIVGFGRFGKTLYQLIKDDCVVTLFTKSQNINRHDLNRNTIVAKNEEEIYKSDVIFYAVPISEFEEVIAKHKKYFRDDHLLIDVLAVKLHPAEVFQKFLKGTATQALLTHPVFGPDSAKNGFEGLPIVLDKFLATDENYSFWKSYFESKKLRVVELSAKEHDKLGANSLGLTQFLGRLLEEFGLQSTPIDPLGAKKLLEIEEQVRHDTWQLFTDLQHFNPYTRDMRLRIGDAYDKLYNKLLPSRINPDFIIYGIQGGMGSFNEEAFMDFVKKSDLKKYEIKYLYTAENVFNALHKGEIDQGQVALNNSVGGVVEETLSAMAKYKFVIVNKFEIKISHALMIRDDADLSDVTTIMSHPQVFAQCKTTLPKKYPNFKLVSGEGELIDHAVVAKQLSEHKLPKNIATMGSKILAKIYNLKIIEDNLQDAKENFTSFLHVARV